MPKPPYTFAGNVPPDNTLDAVRINHPGQATLDGMPPDDAEERGEPGPPPEGGVPLARDELADRQGTDGP